MRLLGFGKITEIDNYRMKEHLIPMIRNVVTVREHDCIYKNNGKYEEEELPKHIIINNKKLVFINDKNYNDFEFFVKDFTDKQDKMLLYYFSTNRNMGQNFKDNNFASVDSFFSIGKNKIIVRNYVGAIQLPTGLQIDILPKIDLGNFDADVMSNADIEKKTRDIFLKMLKSMTNFPYRVFEKINLSNYNISLFEIFIFIYLQEILALTREGLKSKYLCEDNNHNFFKGKLLINEHIKRNAAHKERFYVEYDNYSLNRPENRLIKSALELLLKSSVCQINQKLLYQILPYFDGIDVSMNFEADFMQIVPDRITCNYKNIMPWTKIILYNFGINTFAGKTSARSLLFRMNDLFELYVFKEFRKTIAKDYDVNNKWDVERHVSNCKEYLFNREICGDIIDESGKYRLEPDIAVRSIHDKTLLALLDTKWKKLKWDNPNHGVSNEDMYQMFVYSDKYNTKNIWLIYPQIPICEWHKDNYCKHSRLSFESDTITKETKTIIRVFFLDLENITDSLKELVNEIKKSTE